MTAIGHFNISDLVGLNAVAVAARRVGVPVLIGTSEGERAFIGARQAAAVVRSIRDEYDFPIFLNGDHTHSLAKAEEAARAGYDMVGFDGSTLPFEENVRQTKQAVEAIKSINSDIVVEGELGYIGSGSEIHDTVPALILTKPDEAREFAGAAGVDVLALAVGNMQRERRRHPVGQRNRKSPRSWPQSPSGSCRRDSRRRAMLAGSRRCRRRRAHPWP
jgi:fructose-bisphosphate aldolase, class II